MSDPSSDSFLLLYTTWPDAEMAKRAAHEIIAAELAACANVIPGMASVYRWRGQVETAEETVVVFKAAARQAADLRAAIVARHPYEIPCVLALPVDGAHSHAAYLAWLGGEVGG